MLLDLESVLHHARTFLHIDAAPFSISHLLLGMTWMELRVSSHRLLKSMASHFIAAVKSALVRIARGLRLKQWLAPKQPNVPDQVLHQVPLPAIYMCRICGWIMLLAWHDDLHLQWSVMLCKSSIPMQMPSQACHLHLQAQADQADYLSCLVYPVLPGSSREQTLPQSGFDSNLEALGHTHKNWICRCFLAVIAQFGPLVAGVARSN